MRDSDAVQAALRRCEEGCAELAARVAALERSYNWEAEGAPPSDDPRPRRRRAAPGCGGAAGCGPASPSPRGPAAAPPPRSAPSGCAAAALAPPGGWGCAGEAAPAAEGAAPQLLRAELGRLPRSCPPPGGAGCPTVPAPRPSLLLSIRDEVERARAERECFTLRLVKVDSRDRKRIGSPVAAPALGADPGSSAAAADPFPLR